MPLLIKAELSQFSTKIISGLINLLIENGNINTENIDVRGDFHCTLLYTEKTCYLPKLIENYSCEHKDELNIIKDIALFGKGSILVLLLESSFLTKRNQEILTESKAIPQYEKFVPHITIGYLKNDTLIRASDIDKIKNKFQNIVVEFSGEKGKFIA